MTIRCSNNDSNRTHKKNNTCANEASLVYAFIRTYWVANTLLPQIDSPVLIYLACVVCFFSCWILRLMKIYYCCCSFDDSNWTCRTNDDDGVFFSLFIIAGSPTFYREWTGIESPKFLFVLVKNSNLFFGFAENWFLDLSMWFPNEFHCPKIYKLIKPLLPFRYIHKIRQMFTSDLAKYLFKCWCATGCRWNPPTIPVIAKIKSYLPKFTTTA